jgi:acetyl esterase/lipase
MQPSSSSEPQPFVIPVWPGGAPGSETWDQQETESISSWGLKVVRNVTQPTLTAYLPDPATATGQAMIICPGGGWHFLSIDMEGHDVARWLCGAGIAAFVLKYRLVRTGDNFQAEMNENLSDWSRMGRLLHDLAPLCLADAQQAIRLVRGRAGEWGIAPDRIGLMGFSAGGMVTMITALRHDAASRPDFAAPIYTAPYDTPGTHAPIPADAPPLFILCAGDDEMAAPLSVALYSDWTAAHHPAELHIYAEGGHGFGMQKLGKPSDHWIELLGNWLAALPLSR